MVCSVVGFSTLAHDDVDVFNATGFNHGKLINSIVKYLKFIYIFLIDK